MTTENWLTLATLGTDIIKTIIPFAVVFLIFWLFRKELRVLIKSGGWKFSAPGVSVETAQKQQKTSVKEKREIEALNKELETTKKAQEKLQELQEYTARDKDTYFLGYHFEKTYRIIFPSQMLILTTIQSFGEISKPLAESIFRRTIWSSSLNIPLEHFTGFLINVGLMVEDKQGNKFLLTPLGNLFLLYLTVNSIPNKLPANDLILNPNPST